MLTFSQLKQYYFNSNNIPAKSILVEYLQYEILDSIYKQKNSNKLIFIGGTGIRIVHGGNRFSEDLDFDNFGLSFDDFQELIDAVIADMKIKGFVMETRLVKKGAYHCYIKFPHLLQQLNLSLMSNEKILVRIDTVYKNKLYKSNVYTLNKFDIYKNILTNPIDIALSQKLITILQRKREKGRDFYDVSYLYGKTQPNFDYIEKTLSLTKSEFIKKLLLRCDELNFSILAEDVKPFLIDYDQINRVVNFNDFIKKQLS